jgi:hypothetical protein
MPPQNNSVGAFAVKSKTVTGTSLRVSPLTYEWTDRITFTEVPITALVDASELGANDDGSIGRNVLLELFAASDEIPDVSNYHSSYPDCCCSGVIVVPQSVSKGDAPTSDFLVDVSWLMIRRIHGFTPDKQIARTVAVVPFQSQEIRNFDNQGKRTRVYYNANTNNLTVQQLFPPYRIADIRCPRVMYSLRITQYEDVGPKGEAGFKNIGDLCEFTKITQLFNSVFGLPMYNKNEWNNYPANTLLYLGADTDVQGLPIAKRTYEFLINDRGWNKFLSVYTQQNGYVPKELNDLPLSAIDPATAADAITQNGIGVFDMLTPADFSVMLSRIGTQGLFPE